MPDNPILQIPARGGHVSPEQPPMTRVRIVATGEYGRPIPPPLLAGLLEEIAAHMKGYGLTDIQVEGGPNAG